MQQLHEIWKTVTGYEDYYEISNHGRIRSLGRQCVGNGGTVYYKKPKILKQPLSKGYHTVNLTDRNGLCKRHYIHRLVAKEFLSESDFDYVNHKDTDKRNNNHLNLEWVSHEGNTEHARLSGLLSPYRNPSRARLSAEQVTELRELRSKGVLLKTLAAQFGISSTQVSLIYRNKSWVI